MPVYSPELAVGPAGRRLAFTAHPAERAHIFRRVGGPAGFWQRVAVHASSPYLDEDALAPGSLVEYYLLVQANTEANASQERSHLVSATI